MPLSPYVRRKLVVLCKSEKAGDEVADAIDTGTAGSTISAFAKDKLANGIGNQIACNDFVTKVQSGGSMSDLTKRRLNIAFAAKTVVDQMQTAISAYV